MGILRFGAKGSVGIQSFCLLCMLGALLSSCDDRIVDTPHESGPDTTSHDFIWSIYEIPHSIGGPRFGGLHQATRDHLLMFGAFSETRGGLLFENNIAEFLNDSIDIRNWKLYEGPYGASEIQASGVFPDGGYCIVSGYQYLYVDGNGQIVKKSTIPSKGTSAYDGWGSSWKNTYFVGGQGLVSYFNGAGWRQHDLPEGWDVRAIDGVGDTAVIATTHPQMADIHYYKAVNGVIEPLPSDSLPGAETYGLYAASMSDIYAARMPLMRFNGKKWAIVDYGGALHGGELSIAGYAWNDIFVGGHYCSLTHFNGKTWKQVSPYFMQSGWIYYIEMGKDVVWVVIHGLDMSYWLLRGVRR